MLKGHTGPLRNPGQRHISVLLCTSSPTTRVEGENATVTTDRYSIITDGLPSQLPDIDPEETREWTQSLDAAIDADGRQRARYLMLRMLERARERQVGVPALRSTDYINSIPPEREPWFPGDEDIERRILMEGPESVAAVFLEPVQNSGGCFPPPPGYFQKVREICDKYGVLLVSDEVICAFGRLGEWFGAQRYGYQPDMITVAKGMSSGYAPIGAMIASDKLIEPFLKPDASFLHGITFAGHPVSSAVALANLDLFEREGLLQHVRTNEDAFRATLEKLLDLPIVGDVRGDGYFYGIELVKDKHTRETFSAEESERILRGFLSKALFDAGLICRADDRGDPVIQLAPPLIVEQEQFDTMEQILRSVLTEAWTLL